MNFKKKAPKNPAKDKTVIVIDVLLHISKESKEGNPIPCRNDEEGDVEVIPIVHNLISQISSIRLHYPKDLRPLDNRKIVLKTIQEAKKRFPKGLPLLHPIEDMKIQVEAFKDIVKKIELLEEKLYAHPLHKVRNR